MGIQVSDFTIQGGICERVLGEYICMRVVDVPTPTPPSLAGGHLPGIEAQRERTSSVRKPGPFPQETVWKQASTPAM